MARFAGVVAVNLRGVLLGLRSVRLSGGARAWDTAAVDRALYGPR